MPSNTNKQYIRTVVALFNQELIISQKVNIIPRFEFDLDYYNVQHVYHKDFFHVFFKLIILTMSK